MAIRAAIIDDKSLVTNIIMVGQADLADSIIEIPTKTWDDGSIVHLPIVVGETRWTGTEFVDKNGMALAFDKPPVANVEEPQ